MKTHYNPTTKAERAAVWDYFQRQGGVPALDIVAQALNMTRDAVIACRDSREEYSVGEGAAERAGRYVLDSGEDGEAFMGTTGQEAPGQELLEEAVGAAALRRLVEELMPSLPDPIMVSDGRGSIGVARRWWAAFRITQRRSREDRGMAWRDDGGISYAASWDCPEWVRQMKPRRDGERIILPITGEEIPCYLGAVLRGGTTVDGRHTSGAIISRGITIFPGAVALTLTGPRLWVQKYKLGTEGDWKSAAHRLAHKVTFYLRDAYGGTTGKALGELMGHQESARAVVSYHRRRMLADEQKRGAKSLMGLKRKLGNGK